jgi:hypothetical protein
MEPIRGTSVGTQHQSNLSREPNDFASYAMETAKTGVWGEQG